MVFKGRLGALEKHELWGSPPFLSPSLASQGRLFFYQIPGTGRRYGTGTLLLSVGVQGGEPTLQ